MSQAVLLGVPTPCFSTALAFYDGYRSEMLPANLIQVCFSFSLSKQLIVRNSDTENEQIY